MSWAFWAIAFYQLCNYGECDRSQVKSARSSHLKPHIEGSHIALCILGKLEHQLRVYVLIKPNQNYSLPFI
ncbi:MAG: hypothetical protein KME06_02680 [Kastovskya adunca ATA6-11-RM4]|nr:hypothetical protein [Kastovskya adunca ATA6-11-RM4]